MALATKASRTGNMSLLDEAIRQLQEAIRLSPRPDPQMRSSLQQMKRLRAGKK